MNAHISLAAEPSGRIARAGSPAIRLFGWSSAAPEEILRVALAGGRPSQLPGDFVLTADEPDGSCVIVTSVVSSVPYFLLLAPDSSRFVHGPDVFDLVRRAGIPWVWNGAALDDLFRLDHTVGCDTLHRDVQRVPACSVLKYRPGRLEVRTDGFWESAFTGGGTLSDAIRAFEAVLDEQIGAGPVVSLSGGLDSRLILSRFLARGARPLCITMGSAESTDVAVASAIARRFALPHRVVELRAGDYLVHAAEITRAASGTKSARHWHTFLYPKAAGLSARSTHFVGANGEFARTYFLDKGIVARLANHVPGPLAARLFFEAKYGERRQAAAIGAPLPARGVPPRRERIAARLSALAGSGRLLDRLDRFYATHRVRHFIGNGMALYNAVAPTRSPFLDTRWIQAVARLPRASKLGGAFHRAAINANAAGLLEFPAGAEERLARRPPRLGWTSKVPWVGYSPADELLTRGPAAELLQDSTELDALCAPAERRRLLDLGSSRVNGVLLALHFSVAAVRDCGIPIARREAG